jgi:hypothetical protein
VRNITVSPALNPFEVIQVEDYMSTNHPRVSHYTMTEGNRCIWVYYSFMNLYFIFRDGKIVDIQTD